MTVSNIAAMTDNIASLVSALAEVDPAVRSAAATQLSHMGAAARGAVVPLVKAVGDDHEEVCEAATAALEELGAPSPGDLDALAQCLLGAQSPDSAYWAATLIGRLEGEAAPAVPALIKALEEGAATVRQRAAWALGKVGPAAIEAKAALQTAADADDPRLARLAQRALEEIG